MFNQIFNHNKTDEFFFRRDALCYVCYFSLQSIVFEIHEQCRKSTMDNRYQMCFCVRTFLRPQTFPCMIVQLLIRTTVWWYHIQMSTTLPYKFITSKMWNAFLLKLRWKLLDYCNRIKQLIKVKPHMKHGFSAICTLFGTFGIEVCNIDECVWTQLSVVLSLGE